MEIYSTGFREIDKKIHRGGIPGGSVIGLEYPPGSPGQKIPTTMAVQGWSSEYALQPAQLQKGDSYATATQLQFISSGRPIDRIQQHIKRDYTVDEMPDIEYHNIDVLKKHLGSVPSSTGDNSNGSRTKPTSEDRWDIPLLATDIKKPCYVVDSFSDIMEYSPDGVWHKLATRIRNHVTEKNGIALLCLTRTDRSWKPAENYLTRLCDGFIRYQTGDRGGNDSLRIEYIDGTDGPSNGFPYVCNLTINHSPTVDTTQKS